MAVPEYCTCGAKLVEGALFCHKCGRPLRKDLIAEPDEEPAAEEEAAAPPAAEVPAVPSRITFADPLAVRIGLFVGCIAGVLVQGLPLGCMVWLPGAGFLAVYLYCRRQRVVLTGQQAVQLGWITGLFTFTVSLIFFVIGYLMLVNAGGFSEEQKELMRQFPIFGDNVDQAVEMMREPGNQAVAVTFALLFQFVLFTLFPVIGASIAARVLARD